MSQFQSQSQFQSHITIDWMRHGRTISNYLAQSSYTGFLTQGLYGENLHFTGVEDTKFTKDILFNKNILSQYDYIYTSLLPRTIQTGLILFDDIDSITLRPAPYLNELRPWWAMKSDWVNCASSSLKELKEKIENFANDVSLTNPPNISWDHVTDETMWNEMNVPNPKKFYEFVLSQLSPTIMNPKILVISHSWYMYSNLDFKKLLEYTELKKIPNNSIWRECLMWSEEENGFERASIEPIYVPNDPINMSKNDKNEPNCED